jgi:hypothetical protein
LQQVKELNIETLDNIIITLLRGEEDIITGLEVVNKDKESRES